MFKSSSFGVHHYSCLLGAVMLASAAICQSIIDVTSHQALPEMLQNFKMKCERVP